MWGRAPGAGGERSSSISGPIIFAMAEASTSSVGVEGSSSSDCSENEETSDKATAVTLLDVLKAPPVSELNRPRKVLVNRGGKRRKTSSSTSSEPKSVSPQQRVRENPGQSLVLSRGKLFCNACREEVSLKSSSVKNHTRSGKHNERKKKLERKEKREQEIAIALRAHNAEVHLAGGGLPENHQVFRVKVVTTFLRAGIPLTKLDDFRELLEEGAYRLSSRHSLSDLIPFILRREKVQIMEELNGRFVSLIFDGTCRLGEALCLVVRYLSDDWCIEQRLVALKMLQKSLKGEEIAREIISTLSIDYHLGTTSVLGSMRDRAATNNVALRTLKVLYPNIVDIGCFSHTQDHVGGKFDTPVLSEFISGWINLFAHSPKNKALWRELTGRSMQSFSPTRWWSRWEVMEQLMVQFGDLITFLNQEEIGSPATVAKLTSIISDQAKSVYLQIELAAVVDSGRPFVTATYKLEGDGPLALSCFEVIEELEASIHASHTPNLDALIQKLCASTHHSPTQLRAYAMRCIQPGFSYFRRQISTNLQEAVAIFKAARLFSPHMVNIMRPTATCINTLSVFPSLTPQVLSELKDELPLYMSKASGVDRSVCPLEWWRLNCEHLPKWSVEARKVFLIQPSSAAAERVFSLLKASFSD